MADDIELSDGAADFEADPVIAKGDRAVCDAMSNEEDIYGWNAGNTTVTIQNGEITHVNRIWVPWILSKSVDKRFAHAII